MVRPRFAQRGPSTTFSVGRSATSGDRVFVDYNIPGGQTMRVLDRGIFDEAVKRSGRVLRELEQKYKSLEGCDDQIQPSVSTNGRS